MSKKEVRWRNMNLPKNETINLSGKNIGLRAFAVGVLLLIAVIFLGRALSDFLNTEPGWQSVEVESDTVNVSTEFNFSYDFSDYGGTASMAYKKLIDVYSRATEDAYRIFHQQVEELNNHLNEPFAVDPALYDALALLVAHNNRYFYLAPVYQEYAGIFLSGGDGEAAQFDPNQNPELVPYISQAASFANDSEMIRLELLEDNQVQLFVSEEYLAFAEEYEITKFVDLNWMTNAFVVDFLAEKMTENGYTCGYIASYDGFTRNLDSRGNSYNFNLFDQQGRTIYPAAVFQYNQPISIVFLRNYPMDDKDWLHYYEFENGTVATVFIDPADGMSKASTDSMISYSYQRSCAEILMEAAPVFIADEFTALNAENMHSIWFDDQLVLCSEQDAAIQIDADSGYSRARFMQTN